MYNEIILAGVIISLLYTELTGLSAGLIVPGYLALALHSPWRIVLTLALAAASVGILKLASNFLILYGRRRFAFLILLTFFLSLLIEMTGILPGSVSVIGILIPGIIAREIDRQGIADTFISMAVTTAAVSCILLFMGYPVFG